ncbi:alkylphosphonate utilization protein [Pseudosulfitobacter koreensis]|uniref:Alkylphosphonate utilization protein n=1 Tax=Pseudosulfitobacter koreensis TaxID=2968472 RepID=A0ABT1Z4H0_9RHOB|nr:alkylphosphonate utilization protein [Pseudosulfitobacter koreense]MCR8828021.1 alkylphosphonate utilization protein [Pseudosulfitobacter koreense]
MPCPLCDSDAPLIDVAVSGGPKGSVAICATCADQLDAPQADHFRALPSTMWADDTAVQVLAYRILKRLDADWARDALDMLYLDEDALAWAQDVPADTGHRDANGVPLAVGDNVVLIKDLPVKGAGFTAKRGTPVRGISLVLDNPGQIEGRVEGQRIVILTQFVKKK